jgi:uncharacterized protein with PIN domain
MLGGLARWLRAAGYDATWQADIADWDLIRLAQREGRVLLSCDTEIFRIGIVRDGDLPALLIPQNLPGKKAQLAFVLNRLHLVPRAARCMACGGSLAEVARAGVAGRVPPRSFAEVDHFYECTRCGQLFWEGTHWQKIAAVLDEVRAASGI